ncbi:MAG: glutaredoxin domain-containing protein [Patescibacteria group bacterium]
MANVIIYSTPSCVYCKMAKEFFEENNIQYAEKNVAEDAKAREDMIERSGQMGVPVIDIDGNLVIGFDKEKLSEFLGIK